MLRVLPVSARRARVLLLQRAARPPLGLPDGALPARGARREAHYCALPPAPLLDPRQQSAHLDHSQPEPTHRLRSAPHSTRRQRTSPSIYTSIYILIYSVYTSTHTRYILVHISYLKIYSLGNLELRMCI